LVLLVDDNKEAGLKMIAAGWEFSNSAIRARNQRHLISYHWDTPDVLRQKLDGILPGLEHQESESWVALKPA
jgi:hypothetical protein